MRYDGDIVGVVQGVKRKGHGKGRGVTEKEKVELITIVQIYPSIDE